MKNRFAITLVLLFVVVQLAVSIGMNEKARPTQKNHWDIGKEVYLGTVSHLDVIVLKYIN